MRALYASERDMVTRTSWYLIGNSTNRCAFSASMGSYSASSFTSADTAFSAACSGVSSAIGMPLIGTATSSDAKRESTFSLSADALKTGFLIGDSIFRPSRAEAA